MAALQALLDRSPLVARGRYRAKTFWQLANPYSRVSLARPSRLRPATRPVGRLRLVVLDRKTGRPIYGTIGRHLLAAANGGFVDDDIVWDEAWFGQRQV